MDQKRIGKKIKKLYTIGDSWSYGAELENPKKECWPTLLSREFNCELINESACGGSNDWIFRKTIEWVVGQKSFDDVVVIVSWSDPNRREENYTFIPHRMDTKFKIMKSLYNDELAHYKSICYMIALQECFKSKNIKYLFCYPDWADILNWEDRLIDSRKPDRKYQKNLRQRNYQEECYSEELTIGNIIDSIYKRYCVFPGEWLVNSNFSEKELITLPGGHPNKNEHKLIANFIKEKSLEVYP